MDEYRRKLEEQAEESEFALMFDDYMMDLGEALQNEFEAADSRGEVPDMPEDMKQRLRQFVATYGSSDNNIGVKEQDTVAQPVKSRRQTHKWLRRMGVAAASIAVMFAAMVTVQAAGVDVFGAIGRWTDSVFHFEGENKETIIQSPNESIAEK